MTAYPPGLGFRGGPPLEYDLEPTERAVTITDFLTHTSGVMSGPIGNAESQALGGPRNDIGVSYVVRITIGDHGNSATLAIGRASRQSRSTRGAIRATKPELRATRPK